MRVRLVSPSDLGAHLVELRLGGRAPGDRLRAPQTVRPRGNVADWRRLWVRERFH